MPYPYIDQFEVGQAGVLQRLNEMFDAIHPLFTRTMRRSESLMLDLTLHGGPFKGIVLTEWTDSLPANTVSYVEMNATTGAPSFNSTGYTSGLIPLGKATTNGDGIVTYLPVDRQVWTPTP